MILPKDEEVMKAILNEVGPIAISINASLRTFQLYSEGIYDDKDCSKATVNHAMLLVGYGPDYWILSNDKDAGMLEIFLSYFLCFFFSCRKLVGSEMGCVYISIFIYY